MQKTYLLVGAVALVIGALLWFGGEKPGNSENGKLTPVSQFDHAHGITLDSKDASKLYIATHEGLYVLQNDKDLFRIGGSEDDLMGFTAHPTDTNVFFSSGHPARGGNIGFQKSVDGGMTWKQISQGLGGPVDFHAMTVSFANPDVVYGFFGGKLQRSTDGGKNWEYAKGAVSPISLSSDPIHENVVYASTQSGVRMSKDRGDSWESVSPQLEGGAVSTFALQPTDVTYALAFSEQLGGLGKSMDGGTTWQGIRERFGESAVLYLAFSTVDPEVVYVLTNSNSIYKSTDRGESWSKIR